jgi:hypothetical protein
MNKMFLLSYIKDRWEAQKRAEMEREAREIAEDIVMKVVDATEPNKQEAERLKMKVARILLREEVSDSWKPPHKGKNDDYTASRDSLSEG